MDIKYNQDKQNIYNVDLDVYAGPLDLLLTLIENAELDITKVSLGIITNQYLYHLSLMQERNLAEVSSFIVIAAKLIQIKSNSLLPKATLPEIYDEGEDLGDALVEQLLLYKKFKDIGNYLKDRENEGLHSHLRIAPPPFEIESRLDLSNISLADILLAAQNALMQAQDIANLDEVVTLPRVTIREKIYSILDVLQTKPTTNFRNLLIAPNRLEIVVTFLAMLELIKRHIVQVTQSSTFGEIELTTTGETQEIIEEDLEF